MVQFEAACVIVEVATDGPKYSPVPVCQRGAGTGCIDGVRGMLSIPSSVCICFGPHTARQHPE